MPVLIHPPLTTSHACIHLYHPPVLICTLLPCPLIPLAPAHAHSYHPLCTPPVHTPPVCTPPLPLWVFIPCARLYTLLGALAFTLVRICMCLCVLALTWAGLGLGRAHLCILFWWGWQGCALVLIVGWPWPWSRLFVLMCGSCLGEVGAGGVVVVVVCGGRRCQTWLWLCGELARERLTVTCISTTKVE